MSTGRGGHDLGGPPCGTRGRSRSAASVPRSRPPTPLRSRPRS